MRNSSEAATQIAYESSELEVFANAINWKDYWASVIRPHVGGRVLEVGAGLGGSTDSICHGDETEWCCLEPDAELCSQIRQRIEARELPPNCRVQTGVVEDLSQEREWDAILYIDVLEHLEAHVEEMRAAAARLAPGGTLSIVSPAHGWLYSPFDAAIGHFRRYDRASLTAIMPRNLELVCLKYLDSVGVLLSLANRMLLRSPEPSREQIGVWDRFVVPVSRRLDPLLGYRLGKTIVGVWRYPGS